MRSVLVIDDDVAIRDYLSTLIKRLGYEVNVAESATEGLQKMGEAQDQVIIADIYMPDAPPAKEWIAQLAKCAQQQRVILISGESNRELTESAAAAGITTFLSKPFELAFIRNLLAEAFSQEGA